MLFLVVQVLRYFPLKERLILAYKNPRLAKLFRCHSENRNEESMCGPFDCKAWSHITSTFPTKLSDPLALRLGLAVDGVSPFSMGGHSTPYSVWPVFLTAYNLPPWVATKEGFSWVSMILPGNELLFFPLTSRPNTML